MTKLNVMALARSIIERFQRNPDAFLHQVRGVIHVGANIGQERQVYDSLGLRVLWIEPIPEIYKSLCESIAPFPKQEAFQALIADRDNQEYTLHLSSNEGASSSILQLAEHKKIWPDVGYVGSITLNSITLSTLARQKGVDLSLYDGLVMDTQGSEILVLRGASDILHHFHFIKTEVADFEAYKGCCQLSEMDEFLSGKSFKRIAKRRFAHKRAVGSYYEALYARSD